MVVINMSILKHATDDERLTALENAFVKQSSEAIIVGKIRGVATMKAICKLANVDPTYAYGKNNPSPENLKKYKKFQEKVNTFADTFKNHKNNVLGNVEDNQDLLEAAREQLFNIKIENNSLLNKLSKSETSKNNLQAELVQAQLLINSNQVSAPTSQLNDNTIHIISPDKTLQHNDQYQYFDIELRDKAWDSAKEDFQRLMRRKVPLRVYLLVGLPCSGKSTWVEERDVLRDRHTVIIDATNLKKGDRAQWITLARKNTNVKICAVMFFTDFLTIKERNAKRHPQNKFIDVSILETKRDAFELVDVKFEDIDEMIIVRED